jgi:hypothetical protein
MNVPDKERILDLKMEATQLAATWKKQGYIVSIKPMRMESNNQIIVYYVKGNRRNKK